MRFIVIHYNYYVCARQNNYVYNCTVRRSDRSRDRWLDGTRSDDTISPPPFVQDFRVFGCRIITSQ